MVDKLQFIGVFETDTVVGEGLGPPAISINLNLLLRDDETPSPTVLNDCKSVAVEGF